MLGTIGFTSAAIVFLLYGFSSQHLGKKHRETFNARVYLLAYVAMALACAGWALATIDTSHINAWVMVGDTMLMAATVLMLGTITIEKYNPVVSISVAFLAVFALVYRGMNLNPAIHDGVLVFNTPRLFGLFLVLVVLVVWLQANMRFYSIIIQRTVGNDILRPVYFSSNLIGFVAVVGFMFARKTITITTSFTLLIVSFLVLTFLNYYVRWISQRKEVVHAA